MNTSTKKHFRLLNNKIKSDKVWKIISSLFAWFFSFIFIGLIIFIIIQSIPGFKAYGIDQILFSNEFNLANTKSGASVWFPLAITLLVSGGAVLFATPIAIKTATFIKFRIKNKKFQKFLKIAILTLAGIPSVVFGLFAIQALGPVLSTIFNIGSAQNIITSCIMLGFIVLPTIISLTLNTYDGIDMRLIENGIGMGSSYTRSIYKIFKKEARGGIIIAVIIALGRAIGETMAISMILSDQGYQNVFDAGFIEVLKSALRPLGAVISANMFAENGGDDLKGLLYVFGIILFVFIMVLNGIVVYLTRKKKKKNYKWFIKFEKKLDQIVFFIPNQFAKLYEKITFKSKNELTLDNLNFFVTERIQTRKGKRLYTVNKIFWEVLAFSIAFSLLGWISLDIIINGIKAATLVDSSLFLYTKNTTGQATINTLIIICLSILIGLPISLFTAIFLNEYAKNKWPKKLLLFFIDSFGSTPSIIFAMFGLVMFVEVFGFTSMGSIGKSLLAGALTITLVILPTFTRAIQQALQSVPMAIRENAFGMGNSKWETIRKLVLPQAKKGIITSVVLTIGRIVSETAPLYLTAGLSSSKHIAILNPGQTLTTRIYAQLYENNAIAAKNVMYEAAFVTLWLVVALIIIAHVLIPYFELIQADFKKKFVLLKNIIKNPYVKNINLFKNQIYKQKIYISYQQAKLMNYDYNKIHAAFVGGKIYEIKYLEQTDLEAMALKLRG